MSGVAESPGAECLDEMPDCDRDSDDDDDEVTKCDSKLSVTRRGRKLTFQNSIEGPRSC